MIASFTNHKPYPPPLQNLIKQPTRLHSHLIKEKDIDINKIKDSPLFLEEFLKYKKSRAWITISRNKNVRNIKYKNVTHWVCYEATKLYEGQYIVVFKYGCSLMNPGPTGAGALIFRVGMDKTLTKPPEAVFFKQYQIPWRNRCYSSSIEAYNLRSVPIWCKRNSHI